MASEAGPAHLTVLIGFLQIISFSTVTRTDSTDLDLSNDIEAILPSGVGEVDPYESIGDSVCIASCTIERVAKVETRIGYSVNTAS